MCFAWGDDRGFHGCPAVCKFWQKAHCLPIANEIVTSNMEQEGQFLTFRRLRGVVSRFYNPNLARRCSKENGE